ncbi:MAG TPA: LacI family DNA-binding transcriptional regulator [Bryobacteraceae bacterium]|jgi:LacI family transcriptional regulator
MTNEAGWMERTRNSHPTLADVARRAGVGKATVSRVINGGRKVSPETLNRINQVIRELDYRPSQAARSLKGNGTKAIGLVLPSIADPFFSDCAEAAQEVARSNGYLMIVAATNYDPPTEIHQLESLIRHRVEGILLAPADAKSKSLATLIDSLAIPVITFNHPLQKAHVPSVLCENRRGTRMAIEHLLKHGYRGIACVGGESSLYSIQERQRGYADAMRAAGLEPLIVSSTNSYAETESALHTLCLPVRKIDAVFAVRNRITIFVFQAMQALGMSIPGDVALVGFDDFDLASTLRPAVTVIRQPVQQIGRSAAKLLFEELKRPLSRSQSRTTQNLLKTALVLRSSCGCREAGIGSSTSDQRIAI